MLRNRYLAFIVAALLLGIILYNLYFFYSRGKTKGISKIEDRPPVAEAIHKRHALAEAGFEPKDNSKWKRDPFKSEIKSDEDISYETFNLEGIIQRDGKGYALINGRLYGIGDSINGEKVNAVERHSVILLKDGKTEKISFKDYIVLKEKKR